MALLSNHDSAPADNIMWLDLEMTTISDVKLGRIMEVGVIFTNSTFELLSTFEEGYPTSFHRVIRLSEEDLSLSSEWSKRVHTQPRPIVNKSLFQLCAESEFSIEQVDMEMERMIRQHAKGKPIIMAGASIACDKAFVDVHMPRVSALLHHRMIDVSGILEIAKRMYPGYRPHVSKLPSSSLRTQHSAMWDIVASLRLMHELQQTIFMPMVLISRVPASPVHHHQFHPAQPHPYTEVYHHHPSHPSPHPPPPPHSPMFMGTHPSSPAMYSHPGDQQVVMRHASRVPVHIFESKLESEYTNMPTSSFGYPMPGAD